MKRLLILLATLLLVAPQSRAQNEKPPMDLPVFPGGSVTMEINMSAQELISALEAMMPLMTEKVGALGQALSPTDIADVLRDVRRIEYVQVEVPKVSATIRKIADFYLKMLPSGQWSRVFWTCDENSTIGIFTQANTEQIYGFILSNTQQDGKILRTARVLKIEGRIDFVKALKLGVKAGAQGMLELRLAPMLTTKP